MRYAVLSLLTVLIVATTQLTVTCVTPTLLGTLFILLTLPCVAELSINRLCIAPVRLDDDTFIDSAVFWIWD